MVRSPSLFASRPVSSGPRRTFVIVAAAAAAIVSYGSVARAQQAVTLNGPPVQVVPTASEPGVPTIVINPGTPNPFPGSSGTGTGGSSGGTGFGDGNDGSGTDPITGDGNTGGSSGGAGGSSGGGTALGTMLATPWGATATANAQSVGLNPSALAATCVLESGCAQPSSGSGAQGVFQMFPAAFNEGLATALAANPELNSQINRSLGANDPVTAAIAASGYLMQADKSLQNAGIANPTVLDARAYFNFGPRYSAAVATADDSVPMGQLVSASALAGNRVSPDMTVGQWRSSVSGKIGNAATQGLMI